jgi:hypothetical protein
MMKKMRTTWLSVCLVVLAFTGCDFPRLSPLTDGGDDGATSDGGPSHLDLELLAGDIGSSGNVDGTGSAARFSGPSGVTIDSAGNIYVADQGNSTIRKITAAGVVTTLAGAAGKFGTADGSAATARFDFPSGVAVDRAGNIYVADTNNSTIRKITTDGSVMTLAGAAGIPGGADGTGAAARFNSPSGVAVDLDGNVYVADRMNETIRKVAFTGVVTTLAGTAGMVGSTDGMDTTARFDSPSGVAVDRAGNVYVADQNNQIIRKVTATGGVTTLAGTAGMAGSTDGTGAAARFNSPSGVAVDGAGNVYVADQNNHILRKITAAGVVTTLAGTAGMAGSADGTGAAARFNSPSGAAVDSAGNVYVADQNNQIIRRVSAGVVMTLAGAASMTGSADGTGAAARFSDPSSVAVDSTGNVYVADTENATIRKITAAGAVTTLAGTADMVGSTDGTAAAARFSDPSGVAVDSAGNVYVADTENATIRKITAAGVVTTLAGTAGMVGKVDGMGAAARFDSPSGVAVDTAGNVYVADQSNHTIRMVTPAGVVRTLAGTPGMFGSADGMGAAARFNFPSGVAVDSAGNLYVADQNNHTIRKVTAAGVVTTLAGVAGMTGSADGTGAAARFNSPSGVAVDSAGNVYVADIQNSTIRKVTPTGATTTVAGTSGVSGILLGTMPRFAFPRSLAIAGDGIVISDTDAILLLRRQ